MEDKIKVGWVVDNMPPASKGRQFSIKNFRDAAPDNVEIVDITPEKPEECDVYAVHSVQIPQNLPRFSKKKVNGKFKPHPVVQYAHQLLVADLGANYVIYQSPYHARFSQFGKKVVLPPPIVEADYKDDMPFVGDKSRALWIGDFTPEEGTDIAIRWSETSHITTDYFGSNMPQQESSNSCFFNGWAPHETMPLIYKSHSKMIFMARSPQPFGRALAEGFLAGLELTVSGDLGFTSFEESVDDTFNRCLKSADEYWQFMLEVVLK